MCNCREILAEQIRKTMDEIVALERSDFAWRLQTKLDCARKRKDALIQEYMQHLRSNTCEGRQCDCPRPALQMGHRAAHA